MRIRNQILGGAAMLALTATAVFAGESTPAEKEQTRQLNTAAQVYANGVPAEQALPDSIAPRIVDYSAVAQPPASGPADVASSTTTLSSIEHPSPSIANAPVVSSDGQTVGLVQKVQLDALGKAASVDVALKEMSKTVTFDAHDVSYDPAKNTIISASSREQILSMPGEIHQG